MDFWSTVWTIGGFAVGTVGLLLSIYFYSRTRQLTVLAFAGRTFPIVTERSTKVPDLEVSVKGEVTPVVSVTRLAIWNAGNTTIRRTDIPSTEVLLLSANENVTIYNVSVIENANENSLFSVFFVENARNCLNIDFEYIDPGDGIVIDLVHNSSSGKGFKLKGKLIGGRIEAKNFDPETVLHGMPYGGTFEVQESARARCYFQSCLFGIVGILALACGFFVKREMIFMGLALVIFAVVTLFYARKRYPPRKLKSFDDNL